VVPFAGNVRSRQNRLKLGILHLTRPAARPPQTDNAWLPTLGPKLWDLPLPLTKSYSGNATSPAIFGNLVILYRGNYVDHFLLAVNKKTGEEVWRVKQDEPFTGEMACTACPIVVDGKLIVHTARAVQAFQLTTGKPLWKVNDRHQHTGHRSG
jgi:outer membrane protein assembly factor BamB